MSRPCAGVASLARIVPPRSKNDLCHIRFGSKDYKDWSNTRRIKISVGRFYDVVGNLYVMEREGKRETLRKHWRALDIQVLSGYVDM